MVPKQCCKGNKPVQAQGDPDLSQCPGQRHAMSPPPTREATGFRESKQSPRHWNHPGGSQRVRGPGRTQTSSGVGQALLPRAVHRLRAGRGRGTQAAVPEPRRAPAALEGRPRLQKAFGVRQSCLAEDVLKDPFGWWSRRLETHGEEVGLGEQPLTQTRASGGRVQRRQEPTGLSRPGCPLQRGGQPSAQGPGAVCFASKESLALWNVYLLRNVNLQTTPSAKSSGNDKEQRSQGRSPPFLSRSAAGLRGSRMVQGWATRRPAARSARPGRARHLPPGASTILRFDRCSLKLSTRSPRHRAQLHAKSKKARQNNAPGASRPGSGSRSRGQAPRQEGSAARVAARELDVGGDTLGK